MLLPLKLKLCALMHVFDRKRATSRAYFWVPFFLNESCLNASISIILHHSQRDAQKQI